MDWFFDNLGKLIPILIAIVYFLGSLKGRGEKGEEQDVEAQERARKIQEEIRRKILERQQGGSQPQQRPQAPPPAQAPEPAIPPPLREATPRRHWKELHPQEPKSAREAVPTPGQQETVFFEPPAVAMEALSAEIDEQRRQASEQLEKARRIRAKSAAVSASQPLAEAGSVYSSGNIRSDALAQLDSKPAIKSAFVLKEILDTPVGLR